MSDCFPVRKLIVEAEVSCYSCGSEVWLVERIRLDGREEVLITSPKARNVNGVCH